MSAVSTNLGQNGSYSGINSPQETEKMNDNNRLLPLTTKASSNEDSVSVEYGKQFLPPVWVDIQEEIDGHLDEISKKSIPLDVLIWSFISGGIEKETKREVES